MPHHAHHAQKNRHCEPGRGRGNLRITPLAFVVLVVPVLS